MSEGIGSEIFFLLKMLAPAFRFERIEVLNELADNNLNQVSVIQVPVRAITSGFWSKLFFHFLGHDGNQRSFNQTKSDD